MKKDKTTAIVLSIFLGGIGLHKFYLEKPFKGLLYFFFSWTLIPAFLGLVEGISYMTYSQSKWDKVINNIDHTVIKLADVPRDEKKCPECAEIILSAAKVCKHCGYRITIGA